MKKFKFGFSFLLLVLICILMRNFLLLVNYLFALTLHELAHLFVATKCGYSLKQFKLNMFGVSVELDEKINDKDSFAINIAGPMFNLLLCVFCVALYWLIPISFKYLNLFCMSNLTLAVFNLLPVYPLDGGKIFKTLFSNNKKYKILDLCVRLILIGVSLILFLISLSLKPNLFFILLVIFFLIPIKQDPTLTLFKTKKDKKFEKIVLLKASEEETLFMLLKKIKPNHYTIFYFNEENPIYLDEDKVLDLATKFPLQNKMDELIYTK